jgi:hypothetical protein
MGPFLWSHEKNAQLLANRDLCFEAVVAAIEAGDLLDVLEHPNPDRYPGQRVLVVQIGESVVLVPFVVDGEGALFLKTMIPSRKATRTYLKGQS